MSNKRRDRTVGIAVDEDGEHRNFRRMSHGRHVVNECLKPESNFGTKAHRYVKNITNIVRERLAKTVKTAFFGVRFLRAVFAF